MNLFFLVEIYLSSTSRNLTTLSSSSFRFRQLIIQSFLSNVHLNIIYRGSVIGWLKPDNSCSPDMVNFLWL